MIITGIGDCGVDEYIDHNLIIPGGTTLNFAANAKALFNSTATVQVISAIGNDNFSEVVAREVKKRRIIPLLAKKKGKTSTQYIDHLPTGEKVFTKYEAGVLQNFTLPPKYKKVVKESDIVMTVIYQQIEKLFNSTIAIKSKGIMAVDFMDLGDYKKDSRIVENYVHNLDIAIFGLKATDISLLDKLQRLAFSSNKLFIITLGENGSKAFYRGKIFSAQAVPVEKVIDTTGAGDAFAAGFLKEYMSSKDINQGLFSGNIYAAKTIQKVGAI